MDWVVNFLIALNGLANAVGQVLLAPLAVLPGWLSATVVSALTGVLLLVVFKYTSNQRAIKRCRDDISAQMLSLKLFKDSARVAVVAQGRILLGAGKLFVLALAPMLVMMLPVCLVLGQMSLWYQSQALRVGDEALLTVYLAGEAGDADALPEVNLRLPDGVEHALGPVRVGSKRAVCWNLRGRGEGYHRLRVTVDGQSADKEVAVGDGYMRVSVNRPERLWYEVLLHPWEPPLDARSPVRSITIDYPPRPDWLGLPSGWVVYWFAVSMVAGLSFRRVLNVHV